MRLRFPQDVDETDRRLLALLRQNARESFTRLAQHVGTSEGTVRARIKRLVDDGVIQRFTIRTAGNHVKALIELKVTSNVHVANVTQTIRAWDGVEAVWEVTGDDDVVVVADCPDTQRLNELIDLIRDIPGTSATRSRLILKEA